MRTAKGSRCLWCVFGPLGISFALGILFWVADAVYGYYSFSDRVRFLLFEQPLTLWDSLFYRIPPHDFYVRMAFFAVVLMSAAPVAVFLVRRKQAEIHLEWVNGLVQNSPIIAIEWEGDEDSRPAFVTGNISRLLGYSADELMTHRVVFRDIVHPADVAGVREEIRKAIEDPKVSTYAVSPHRIETKQGEMRWMESRGVIRRNADGKAVRREEIVIDVTEQQFLEQRLREQQKLESLGILSAGVAHEINNPLTGVINYAELISTRVQDEKAKEYSEAIITEGMRIAKIVSSLLTYARREADARGFAKLGDLVDDVLILVGATLRKDQIQLHVDMPEDLPQIVGNRQEIEQVLINLLMNSRDALNQRFEGYDEKKTLSILGRRIEKSTGQFVRVTVEDNGVGIQPEIRSQVFDPFFTTKSRTEGTGLGLAISLSITQAHHGDLSCSFDEDHHTQFHLDLPVP